MLLNLLELLIGKFSENRYWERAKQIDQAFRQRNQRAEVRVAQVGARKRLGVRLLHTLQ
jgi:hypothetical protein